MSIIKKIGAVAEDRDYLDRLISERDAAAYLNVSMRTLQGWRLKGGGPHYVKAGTKSIRYRRRDLAAWVNAQIRTNTSEDTTARPVRLDLDDD
jgi:predicted DNA-binding transcriptional regulator AlpA